MRHYIPMILPNNPMSDQIPSPLSVITHADVGRWFRIAWPERIKYPSEEEFQNIADNINKIYQYRLIETLQKPYFESLKIKKCEYQLFLKNGRAFIRTSKKVLDDLVRKVESLSSLPNEDINRGPDDLMPMYKNWRIQHLELIEIINKANCQIENVICRIKLPEKWKSDDPMKWIADVAIDSWKSLGSNTPALGRYTESPLVEFVLLVLDGIGMTNDDGNTFSHETVSDHLMERIGGGGNRRRNAGANRST